MSGENSKSKESTWKGMISQHKRTINIGKFKDLSDLYDGCDCTRKRVLLGLWIRVCGAHDIQGAAVQWPQLEQIEGKSEDNNILVFASRAQLLYDTDHEIDRREEL